jgi:hypothetical protein
MIFKVANVNIFYLYMAINVQNALEEARTLLEQADRGRRTVEQEVIKEIAAKDSDS